MNQKFNVEGVLKLLKASLKALTTQLSL